MLTGYELRQLCGIPGTFPISLLQAYFSLLLGRHLTTDETYQAIDYLNDRYARFRQEQDDE